MKKKRGRRRRRPRCLNQAPLAPPALLSQRRRAAEVKGSSKPCFFWRSKFTALLLVLAVALLVVSVIHSLATESSVLKDLSFLKEYHQSEVAEIARTSCDRLAGKFHVWSVKSFYFISELISKFRGEHSLGPLQYCNFTALMEDLRVDGYFVFDRSDKGMERMYESDVFGHTVGNVVDIGKAENIVDVQVDQEYEEQVDEEAEASMDSESLEEMDQPEVGAAENIVEAVHIDTELEEHVEQEKLIVQAVHVNLGEVSDGNSNFYFREVLRGFELHRLI